MLTVANIIRVSWPSVMATNGDRYKVTEPVAIPNTIGWSAVMYDSQTNNQVLMVWSFQDNQNGTERDRINLATSLLENAMLVLDDLINEDVEDVTFE